mgnify:CR=1 FL=1
MAEIINLRKARKARARADAEVVAAENRVVFGLSKAERRQQSAEKTLEQRRLDGLRLVGAAAPDKPN